MALKSHTFGFTVFLAALSALPPLAIDMNLPAVPAIEEVFATAPGRGALTLGVFQAGFACVPLFAGPLADRFGRRPVLLVGLVLFTLAAGWAALAASFNALLAARLAQGAAAGICVILPLAVVRDLFEGGPARIRLSQITAVVGLTLLIAPLFGSLVLVVANWRGIYAAQALAGIVLLAAVWRDFAETLPVERRQPLHPRRLAANYAFIFRNRAFLRHALTLSFAFAGLFGYVAASPAVVMGTMGLSKAAYATMFGGINCALIAASTISGRLAQWGVPSRRVIVGALCGMGVAVLSALWIGWHGPVLIATFVPTIATFLFCHVLVGPNATHEAVRPLPHLAGAGSGVLRALQMALSALATVLVSALAAWMAPEQAMSTVMALGFVGSVCAYVLIREPRSPAA